MSLNRLVAVAIGSLTLSLPAPAQQSLERLFYYVDNEQSYTSLLKHIGQISVLGPQAYTVDSLGIVFGSIDRRVLELAKRRDVNVMPLVVNEAFHGPSLRRLLSDTAAQARATRALVALCRENGFWGIQFDIENINLEDKDRFTAWFTAAASALHAAGARISIAVVHRPEEFAGPLGYHRFLYESWREAYDVAALGKASDFISVMTYSQHTRRTPPGPSAGMPWTRDVVDYFLRNVPPDKLSLGIPLSGEHWFTRYDNTLPERARSWSESVSWTWGSGLAERNGAKLQWDSTQAVNWTYYANGGTFEWLFLENARSFGAKLALAREKRLRGFSAWVLGSEDEGIWDLLRS
jgi:spore germination protein YaaH